MVDKFRTSFDLRARHPGHCKLFGGLAFLLLASLTPSGVFAQIPSAASTPVDSSQAAAAGMTSGLSDIPSYRDLEMMQVRTAAQSAQGDAAAASMSRSAGRTLEEQNREKALQEAREIKALKRDATNRMRWERSENAYQKISANDMSTWKTSTGNVRVERSVPDPFLISLIREEEQLAAQQAAEDQNAGPLKKAFGWRPFGKDDAVSSVSQFTVPTSSPSTNATSASNVSLPSQEPESGGGFFSKLRMPKLPSPVNSGNASATTTPAFSSQTPAPAPSVSQNSSPGAVPRISGAELVDGRAPVQRNQNTSEPTFSSAPSTYDAAPSPYDAMPSAEKERSGLFSKLKTSGSSSSSSSSGGGGLFSFGRKKSSGSDGTIDASLFPEDAVSQTPTGGSLTGGYTAEDVAEDVTFASSTGTIQMPGQEQERSRKPFALPKPNISLPNITKIGASSSGSSVPSNTTINSAGTDIYVVTDSAQFMVYGDDPMKSEVRALQPGTVVRMTKAGDQWASISLPDGTQGIVQNKSLRAASAGDGGF